MTVSGVFFFFSEVNVSGASLAKLTATLLRDVASKFWVVVCYPKSI